MILGALGLVGYNFYDSWRADRASSSILDQLDETELDMDEIEGAEGDQSDLPIYELYPDMEMPAKEIDGYRYIAILEIPSLSRKLPVMEDWDYTRLKVSPCRYSGTIYMHNMVIAGHNYGAHFSPIKWMEAGTVIKLKDMMGNKFRYKVAYSEVIQPKDVDGMTKKKKDEEWDLTLFTCTTGGGSRHAVRCVLDNEE